MALNASHRGFPRSRLRQALPGEGSDALQQTRARAVPPLFAILFIIAVYVNIPTSRDGVPMISAFPFALIAGLMFLPKVFSAEARGALLLGLGIYGISLLAPDLTTYFVPRSLAFGQYIYSIAIGLTLYWTVLSFSPAQAARFSEIAIIVLLAGGVIEIFTALSSVLDNVMNPLFGLDEYTQIIQNRDAAIGLGLRRPKFFSSETSYFAMALSFLICTYASLSVRKGSLTRALGYSIVALVVTRSPILVFAFAFVSATIVLGDGPKGRGANLDRLLLGVVIAIPVATVAYVVLSELFQARIQQVSSGADYSSTYRTYGSVYAALAVLSESPFFGIGIGSINAAFRPLTQTYLSLGIPASSVLHEWRFQIQNLPSALLIYLGALGTMFYLGFLYFYARSLIGKLKWQTWALFILLSATASAFYSPRYITFFFLILAITQMAKSISDETRYSADEGRPANRLDRAKTLGNRSLSNRPGNSSSRV
ncbi:hypothetical protein V5F59_17935 [Xanthobacter autotrophicus DSM 431]|uniref:O-antigen ligase family protein n=1 Tax=Xanthobacter nonsaccharivorans TaxID=3119912 RepID=UPI00372AE48A